MDDKNYQEAPLLTTVEEAEQDVNVMKEMSNNKGE
mgnify:CR=1 FL=1|jgi:hypothetical protein